MYDSESIRYLNINENVKLFSQTKFLSKTIVGETILTWCRDNCDQNGGFPRVRSVHCTQDRLVPATKIGHVIYQCGDLRSRSSPTKSNRNFRKYHQMERINCWAFIREKPTIRKKNTFEIALVYTTLSRGQNFWRPLVGQVNMKFQNLNVV